MCRPLWSGCCRVSTSTGLPRRTQTPERLETKEMGMRCHESSRSRLRRLPAAAALAVLALSATAAAGAPERAEYVTRLEAVCKPGVEATQRAVRGVRSDIKAERLSVAARKLSSAARIFDATVREIKPIPRPPLDQTQLDKWFDY